MKNFLSLFVCNRKKVQSAPNIDTGRGHATQLRLSNGLVVQEGKIVYEEGRTAVHEGVLLPMGDRVAVKKVRFGASAGVETDLLVAFYQTTNSWHHPNLVRYFGIDYNPLTRELIVVSEFAPLDFADLKRLTYKEHQIKNYVRQILRVMEDLSEKQLFYIGVKPSNVLALVDGTIMLRDYVATDYLAHLRQMTDADANTNPPLLPGLRSTDSADDMPRLSDPSQRLSLDTGAHNDFVGLTVILKEFYMVHGKPRAELELSPEYSSFIKLLGDTARMPAEAVDFQRFYNHAYLSQLERALKHQVADIPTSEPPRQLASPKRRMNSEIFFDPKSRAREAEAEDFATQMYKNNLQMHPKKLKSWREDLQGILKNMTGESLIGKVPETVKVTNLVENQKLVAEQQVFEQKQDDLLALMMQQMNTGSEPQSISFRNVDG